MAGLFGGNKVQQPTPISGLQVQSSSQGLPIPIIYGKAKMSGNMGWYGDFKAIKHTKKSGKGGGTKQVSYTYQVGVMFCLGEGAVKSYDRAWTTDGPTTVDALGFGKFLGGPDQAPWGYLLTHHPEAALHYHDIAYLANSVFDLGQQANLPQLWFEVNANKGLAIEYLQPNSDMAYNMAFNPVLNEIWYTINAAGFDPVYSLGRMNPATGASLGYIDIGHPISGYYIDILLYDPFEVCFWAIGVPAGYTAYTMFKIDASTMAVLNSAAYASTFLSLNPVTGELWYKTYADVAKINKVTLAIDGYLGADYNVSDLYDSAGNAYFLGAGISPYDVHRVPPLSTTPTLVYTSATPLNLNNLYDPVRNVIWLTSPDMTISTLAYPLNLTLFTLGSPITLPPFTDKLTYDVSRDAIWGSVNNMDGTYSIWCYDFATNTVIYNFSTIQIQTGTIGPMVNELYPAIFDIGYWDVPSNTGSSAIVKISPSGGGDDEEPAYIIRDYLTNPRYGAGFREAAIDTVSLDTADNSYRRYCQALGVKFSTAITNTAPAREQIQRWLDATNTAPVWSDGKIKFIPYGDTQIVGTEATFTPNVDIQYDLTDDDFMGAAGEEPIEISRPDTHDCYNQYQMKVTDKNNEYNFAVVDCKDQASINEIGIRPCEAIEATFIPTPAIGMTCVEMIKNRNLYIRNKFKFNLSWEYILLEPMDLITLTQADMGLDHQAVRILSIDEDDQGLLSIEAEEFIGGIQYSPQYSAQGSEATNISAYTAPSPTHVPVIYEPPYQLVQNTGPQVWVAAGGDDGTWGGCQVWVSTDSGISYQLAGEIQGGSPVGTLTASIAAYGGAMPDMTNTLSVDVGTTGDLSAVSYDDAANYSTLCYVDGELLSYQIPVLTGTGTYDIGTLFRGAFTTADSSHLSGTQFARLDSAVFKYDIPAQYLEGQEIRIKLPAFNVYGNSVEDISTVADYAYDLTLLGAKRPLVISGSMMDVATMPDQIIISQLAPFAYSVPANLSGSSVVVLTNPIATAVINVNKNGVSFATITIDTAGAVTLAGALTTFNINDVITVTAPNPIDSTLAGVLINLSIVKA